jgi:hypothetical protein
MYFDKDGTPVDGDWTTEEGKAEMLRLWNDEYRRVELTSGLGPDGQTYVSTVFLPIDHGWGGDVPIIFETMAFNYELPTPWYDRFWLWLTRRTHQEWEGEWQWRYATEAQARRGHFAVVGAIMAGKNPDTVMGTHYDC